MTESRDPYDLICNPDKTTLTVPGGIALGFGPGPGIRNAIFWNRIGSLFSSYRPAVAVYDVFSADDLHSPLPLKRTGSHWQPNLVKELYSTEGLRIEERRTALKAGLRCLLKVKNDDDITREWIIVFHGSVEQWPFFDYDRREPEPLVECAIEPHLRGVRLTQPHVHPGPGTVNSVQTVTASHYLAAYGLGLNEGDLHALWRDHGCLANLRMRLGQVGGRLPWYKPPAPHKREPVGGNGHVPPEPEPITLRHRHPLYYFAVRVILEPGEMQLLSVASQYHTDDTDGELPGRYDGTAEDEWQEYLREEVPQLDCDDEDLRRYWYYVWYVLRANRTAPGKHIKHPFTAPSKYMYWGTWIWDAYFHVLGEMWLRDPGIARDSIRAVLDSQYPNGYIPVCSGSNYRMGFHEDIEGYKSPEGGGYCSYLPGELEGYAECEHPFEAEVEYRDANDEVQRTVCNEKTQTPLITPAAAEYCGLRRDKDLARELLPKLKAYDDWIWKRRTDEQGRFILWHGDESGWDNATRHYPVPARPFDVQMHCFLHRAALDQLLAPLGIPGDEEGGWQGATAWTAEEQAIFEETRQRSDQTYESLLSYWNGNDRWFYDLAGESGEEQRRQIAASGLFSLSLFSMPELLEMVKLALQNDKVFGSPYPVPTLAQCDPDYAPHGWGWNGPVWLQVNYFVITGLISQGVYDEAFKLWEKTKRLLIRDGRPHSFELYDPVHGTGMGCPDYSWQAMVNHLIIRWFAGVGNGFLSPAPPPGMDRLKVSNLPGVIGSVDLERRGRETRIKVQMNEDVVAGLGRMEQATVLPLMVFPAGLGDVVSVVGNGYGFGQEILAGLDPEVQKMMEESPRVTERARRITPWQPPVEAELSTTWEVVVTCR